MMYREFILINIQDIVVFVVVQGVVYISRIRRNLSIHIARFSASESLRVYTNIYKNSPLFASR